MPSEPLTDEALDLMQARCDAATPGPWYAVDVGGTPVLSLGDSYDSCAVLGGINPCDILPNEQCMRNGYFAAYARTDLPRCLAEIRRLRAEVESLNQQLHAGSTDDERT